MRFRSDEWSSCVLKAISFDLVGWALKKYNYIARMNRPREKTEEAKKSELLANSSRS